MKKSFVVVSSLCLIGAPASWAERPVQSSEVLGQVVKDASTWVSDTAKDVSERELNRFDIRTKDISPNEYAKEFAVPTGGVAAGYLAKKAGTYVRDAKYKTGSEMHLGGLNIKSQSDLAIELAKNHVSELEAKVRAGEVLSSSSAFPQEALRDIVDQEKARAESIGEENRLRGLAATRAKEAATIRSAVERILKQDSSVERKAALETQIKDAVRLEEEATRFNSEADAQKELRSDKIAEGEKFSPLTKKKRAYAEARERFQTGLIEKISRSLKVRAEGKPEGEVKMVEPEVLMQHAAKLDTDFGKTIDGVKRLGGRVRVIGIGMMTYFALDVGSTTYVAVKGRKPTVSPLTTIVKEEVSEGYDTVLGPQSEARSWFSRSLETVKGWIGMDPAPRAPADAGSKTQVRPAE